MIPIIGLVITTFVTSWLVALINNSFNINIQGFSMLIIFPVGAALIGALASSGLAIGRKIDKSTIKSYYIVLVLISGVVAFFATTYFDYRNALISAENTVRREYASLSESDKQDLPLGKLLEDFRSRAGFIDYLKKIHEESTITISSRRGKSAKINNGIVSMISFWISVIGSAVGGWLVLTGMIGMRTKDKHGEYRDLKYLALIDYEKYNILQKIIDDSKKIGDDLSRFIEENPNNKENQTRSHTSIAILMSRKGKDGQIIIEQKTPSGNNQFTSDKKVSHDISSVDTEIILTKLKDLGVKDII